MQAVKAYLGGKNGVSLARILIVEDNPLNLELVTVVLEMRGHEVVFATDAEQGIAMAQTVLPELILMDISLPGMDGLAATQQLRQIAGMADIPVVALTAHAMRGDQERVLAAGCQGYIAKPIDISSFVDEVENFL